MRTELRFGVAADELRRRLSDSSDQMLILGISNLEELRTSFAPLLASPPSFALMIVYRPAAGAL
jgi:hypothetical protein